MDNYDVIIAGGGVAGLSCALTLASSKGRREWTQGRRFLVLDDNDSDLLKAILNNVPGIPIGTDGKKAMNDLQEQVKHYGNVESIQCKVIKVEGERGNFKVTTEDGKEYVGSFVVLATGFHEFNIKGIGVKVLPHDRSPRPGKIMVETDKDLKIKEGVYVAGLLTGISTMYATAAGSGVQVACNIMSELTGNPTIVHDAV